MRVVEIDRDVLRIPDGWTRFLYNGVIYSVNDDGAVEVIASYDPEREAEEEGERLQADHERSLHPRERW